MSETSSPPRRRWRFLYQFSLRTLLLATAAVAIFCNWYFQPKYHEEELAGKDLRLRRQVRLEKEPDPEAPPPAMSGGLGGPPPEPRQINHGHWTLVDGDDFVLSRGHFADDQAAGKWVSYYPTGHKAAEGKMLRGVKVGLWRTWYEDGTLASELNYGSAPIEMETSYRLGPGPTIYNLGVVRSYGPQKTFDPHVVYAASREGPAKAWYENGQLKYEGVFRANDQHGTWTYYDRQGRITATGPFRAGKRHGVWTLTRSVSEGKILTRSVSEGQSKARRASEGTGRRTETVNYIDGRTQAELDRLLARLEVQLTDKHRYRRQQALIDLAEIGEGAVPLLQSRLTTGDKPEQAAILGVLPRMSDAAGALLPVARELSRGGDPIVAHHARLTVFQLDAGARKDLFASLLAEAIAARAPNQALAELVTLYRSDKSQQSAIFAELMRLPEQRKDVTIDQVASAVGKLDGDITAHLVAACQSPSQPVRLMATKILHAMVCAWPYSGQSYVRLDEPSWSALVKRLKGDSSREIQALASEIEQGPQSPFGGGAGFF